SCTCPASTETRLSTVPTSQTVTATTSQLVLNRAAMGALLRDVSVPAAAAAGSAGAGAEAAGCAVASGARLSTSENWLPELNPVETVQSGRCQACGIACSSSKQGRVVMA